MSHHFKILGTALGYPTCCIAHFTGHVDRGEPPVHHPMWRGTGYVPCPSCLEKSLDISRERFVNEVIQPNRQVSTPFPRANDEELRELAGL